MALDQQIADQIREKLDMPNLRFHPTRGVMQARVVNAPTAETQDYLKHSLGCTLSTDALLRTVIEFKHRRHMAPAVIRVLTIVMYVLALLTTGCVIMLVRSYIRSDGLGVGPM